MGGLSVRVDRVGLCEQSSTTSYDLSDYTSGESWAFCVKINDMPYTLIARKLEAVADQRVQVLEPCSIEMSGLADVRSLTQEESEVLWDALRASGRKISEGVRVSKADYILPI